MARIMLLLALAVAPCTAWVTSSQSKYGAQISEIKAQMRGEKVNRDPQAQLGWMWTMPTSTMDTRGLGGGITYAWDPLLCGQLLPRFKESIAGVDLFLNCATIKAAVARAFDKWAANNRFLKFLDVSAECEASGWTGATLADRQANWNHPTISATSTAQTTGGCPYAEIWITKYVATSGRRLSQEGPIMLDQDGAHILDGRRLQDIATYGADALSGGVAVATAQPIAQYTNDFRFTNGARPFNNAQNPDYNAANPYNRRFVEVFAGIFRFNADQICWYMDSFWCSGFHNMKASLGGGNTAKIVLICIFFGLMAIGACCFLCFVVTIILRVTGIDEEHADDEDGDGQMSLGERFTAGVRAISHYNPMFLTMILTCFVVPPCVYTQVILPCFDCYDFEAAALHEIGHFLGLGHPDNIPNNWEYPRQAFAGPNQGNNSYQKDISEAFYSNPPVRPDIQTICQNPWQQVFPGVPPTAPASVIQTPGTYPVRNAQMEARTQFQPLACLTEDDIEALKVLYPDCGDSGIQQGVTGGAASISTNVCHNVYPNIGLVRLAIFVFIPFILLLLCVVCCSTIIHGFERREKERMMVKHAEQVEKTIEAKQSAIANKLRLAAVKAKMKDEAKQAKKAPAVAQTKFTSVSAASAQDEV